MLDSTHRKMPRNALPGKYRTAKHLCSNNPRCTLTPHPLCCCSYASPSPTGTYLEDDATAEALHDNVDDDCTSCPASTYGPTAGATSSGACYSCPSGEGSEERSESCFSCEPGRYANSTSNKCQTCAYGRYSSASGSTSCTSCVAGYYVARNNTLCTTCGTTVLVF